MDSVVGQRTRVGTELRHPSCWLALTKLEGAMQAVGGGVCPCVLVPLSKCQARVLTGAIEACLLWG